MFEAGLRLALAGSSWEVGTTSPCRDQHFVEESLPHLVHNNQVLEGSVGKIDTRGSSERERRMAGKHVGVGITSGEVSGDVERGGVRDVLLHSRQIRSNPHSGDDAARVLTARSQKRTPFSRALNSKHRDSAAPFERAPLLATKLPSSITRGAK